MEAKSTSQASSKGFGGLLFNQTIGKREEKESISNKRQQKQQEDFTVKTNKVYTKPDLQALTITISEFVSRCTDPDSLTVEEILIHVEETYGKQIIGKFGYSKAMIDRIVYRAIGELDPPTQIFENLFLGSEYNASNFNELKNLKITHILNVTTEIDQFFPADFAYKQIHILDDPNAKLYPSFAFACEFLENALAKKEYKCLVHCQRGVSRSASIVIAFVMKQQRISFEEAYKFIKEKRKIVKPNRGFREQLLQWEKNLCLLKNIYFFFFFFF